MSLTADNQVNRLAAQDSESQHSQKPLGRVATFCSDNRAKVQLIFPKYFKGMGKMELMHLEPKNSLELALKDAQNNKITMSDFLHLLVAAKLFIVSISEIPAESQGLHPLIFDRNGIPMAAVYTDSSRSKTAGLKVKSVIEIKGKDIFCHIPRGYGVVINPGFDVGLELLPEGVQNVVNNYC